MNNGNRGSPDRECLVSQAHLQHAPAFLHGYVDASTQRVLQLAAQITHAVLDIHGTHFWRIVQPRLCLSCYPLLLHGKRRHRLCQIPCLRRNHLCISGGRGADEGMRTEFALFLYPALHDAELRVRCLR